jgi:hypothetical protein
MEEASGAAGFGGLVAHVEARLDHGGRAAETRAVAWRDPEEGDRFVARHVALAAVAAVAAGLHTTTLFGGFRLDPATGLQDARRVGVVRWRSGRRVPVTSPS